MTRPFVIADRRIMCEIRHDLRGVHRLQHQELYGR